MVLSTMLRLHVVILIHEKIKIIKKHLSYVLFLDAFGSPKENPLMIGVFEFWHIDFFDRSHKQKKSRKKNISFFEITQGN